MPDKTAQFCIGEHVFVNQFGGRRGIVREIVPPGRMPRMFSPANNRVAKPVESYVVTVLCPTTVTVSAGAGLARQQRQSVGCVRLWPNPSDLTGMKRLA